ncbi:MAG: IS66 family insertion sequence element accessory protein TnpB, partial [Myxococcales bacterium]|nr:IS66 family insertion sequence element accessory protein TnpB [Myxococcales bacterium]
DAQLLAQEEFCSEGPQPTDLGASEAQGIGRSTDWALAAHAAHAKWRQALWDERRRSDRVLPEAWMIGSTRSLRVFAYAQPADLRRSYDGLFSTATELMHRDVLAGDTFLFVNKRRNRAKVLLFDGTSLCIYMKRMDKGRFAALWRRGDNAEVELTMSELSLFLEGALLLKCIPLSPEKITDKDLAPAIAM